METRNLPSKSDPIPLPRRIIYLALPWLVFVLALEAVTRMVYDAPEAGRSMFRVFTMSEPHPDRVWQYKANYRQRFGTDEFDMEIATNSWRLRDDDPDVSADIRVLAIGDSFTFGWGVGQDERYTEFLEEGLRRRHPGTTVEVLNAGHFMASFDQQLLVLTELLPRFRPQVVLQGVYPGHVLSIREHSWTRDADGSISGVGYRDRTNVVVVTSEGILKRTNLWIEKPPLGSRLLAKLAQRYFRDRQVREALIGIPALYLPGEDSMMEAWSMTETAVLQAASAAKTHDSVHIVFDVPQDVQVSDLEWKDYFRQAANERSLDLDHPTRQFAASARDSVWVSLVPTFRDSYEPGLYFPNDPHWTRAGHELAAAALLPIVERELADTREQN